LRRPLRTQDPSGHRCESTESLNLGFMKQQGKRVQMILLYIAVKFQLVKAWLTVRRWSDKISHFR
jgi:hypothetical protein